MKKFDQLYNGHFKSLVQKTTKQEYLKEQIITYSKI